MSGQQYTEMITSSVFENVSQEVTDGKSDGAHRNRCTKLSCKTISPVDRNKCANSCKVEAKEEMCSRDA